MVNFPIYHIGFSIEADHDWLLHSESILLNSDDPLVKIIVSLVNQLLLVAINRFLPRAILVLTLSECMAQVFQEVHLSLINIKLL